MTLTCHWAASLPLCLPNRLAISVTLFSHFVPQVDDTTTTTASGLSHLCSVSSTSSLSLSYSLGVCWYAFQIRSILTHGHCYPMPHDPDRATASLARQSLVCLVRWGAWLRLWLRVAVHFGTFRTFVLSLTCSGNLSRCSGTFIN